MSATEHKEMISRIVFGLQVAEREMLQDKALRGEDVIVCDEQGIIMHVPATNYL